MQIVERLSHVQHTLSASNRVVFPLITPSGTLAGLILRRSDQAHTARTNFATDLLCNNSTVAHLKLLFSLALALFFSQRCDVLRHAGQNISDARGSAAARCRRSQFSGCSAGTVQRLAERSSRRECNVAQSRGSGGRMGELQRAHGRWRDDGPTHDAHQATRNALSKGRTIASVHH